MTLSFASRTRIFRRKEQGQSGNDEDQTRPVLEKANLTTSIRLFRSTLLDFPIWLSFHLLGPFLVFALVLQQHCQPGAGRGGGKTRRLYRTGLWRMGE